MTSEILTAAVLRKLYGHFVSPLPSAKPENITITIAHHETKKNQNFQHLAIHCIPKDDHILQNVLIESKNEKLSRSISNTFVPSKNVQHFIVLYI